MSNTLSLVKCVALDNVLWVAVNGRIVPNQDLERHSMFLLTPHAPVVIHEKIPWVQGECGDTQSRSEPNKPSETNPS